MLKNRLIALAAVTSVAILGQPAAVASETTVVLKYDRGNGVVEEKTVEAVSRTDGMTLVLTPEEAGAFRSLEVVPELARARKGEPGYFVLPNNVLGTFKLDQGEYVLAAKDATMAFWGMKTPRKTFVCQIKGMRWDWQAVVRAKDGNYACVTRFTQEDERPYENIVLDWTFLPADAEYPEMAKAYRAWQLATTGMKSLRERAKERPPLGNAVESPEIRIRMSWKPAPAPVAEQNEFNEPPLKVSVTFARAREFIEACHRAGIGKAEFCLVGWKCRGHDGRYPQIWPVEAQLGGAEELKNTVAAARSLGYNIVLHSNSTDAYSVADSFDEADLVKLKNGELDTCEYTWSGGRPYKLCLQRSYERFARKDFGKMNALGVSGLHYTDVMTVEPIRRCLDPRHPCTKSDTVKWMKKILAEATRNVGGVASEGPIDLAPDVLDCVLYVSYETPGGKKLHEMLDRLVPIWQIVYHGSILSMPFAECTNYTIQGNQARLSIVEFGGRPMFYVNSDYMTGLRCMGKKDLYLFTDGDMERTVAEIKRGADEFARLSDLQYETIEDHRLLSPGVAKTVYGNGSETVVNWSDSAFSYKDKIVPAGDWARFDRN